MKWGRIRVVAEEKTISKGEGKSQVLRDLGFILLPLSAFGMILKQCKSRVRSLHH